MIPTKTAIMSSRSLSRSLARRARKSGPLAAALALFVELFGGHALAQEAGDPAGARVLFSEGRKLSSDGKYAEACPKFEESLRLDRGIGTEFNLADCWAHVQRDASAWALFLNVAAEAKASGQSVREDLARSRAAALEPRLSRLIVQVQAPVAGLELRRDAVVVGSASWGVPVPVDAGAHVIEVTAPGRKKWTRTVQLDKPGAITVEVPTLELEPVASSAPAVIPPSSPPLAPTSSAVLSDQVPPHGTQHTAAWVVGGVGIAALGVGTVFALRTKSKNDSARGICPSNEHCTQAQADEHGALIDSAKSARTVSFVGFGVGGAAVVAAAAVYFSASPASRALASRHWQATPLVAPNAFGGVLEGKW